MTGSQSDWTLGRRSVHHTAIGAESVAVLSSAAMLDGSLVRQAHRSCTGLLPSWRLLDGLLPSLKILDELLRWAAAVFEATRRSATVFEAPHL